MNTQIEYFKPQLNPNNKSGEDIDWDERLGENKTDWLASIKLDGIRGIFDTRNNTIKSRSLTPIRSVEIQNWFWQLEATTELPLIVEGELWGKDLTIEEIKHFVMSKDVTTRKSIMKLKREFGTDKWKFPGRDVEFMSTFPDTLKLYVFDCYVDGTKTKEERYETYKKAVEELNHPKIKAITQREVESLETLMADYNQVVLNGGEGMMLVKKSSLYKFGRHTIRQKESFKMKDDNIKFRGVILDVLEGTNVDPDAEITFNKLGRSVTSKRLEDRIPNGRAKGFLVRMNDGRELTVSLKNIDNYGKSLLLEYKANVILKDITFTGMRPTKVGGMPRHAIFNFDGIETEFKRSIK